jgi:RNA polymerase sigma factor (sigma-70 family)
MSTILPPPPPANDTNPSTEDDEGPPGRRTALCVRGAANEIVARLAVQIGRAYPRLLSIEELAAIGNLAWLETKQRFGDAAPAFFEGYAARCIQNDMMDAIKRELAHGAGIGHGRDSGEAPSDANPPTSTVAILQSPEERLERATVHKTYFTALEEARAELPEEEREVVRKRMDEGRDLKEVAQSLGVGYGTVRRRFHSALERLRRLLRQRSVTEVLRPSWEPVSR